MSTLVVHARLDQSKPWIRGRYTIEDPWEQASLTALLRQIYREKGVPSSQPVPASWLDAMTKALLIAPHHAPAIHAKCVSENHTVAFVRTDLVGRHLRMDDDQIVEHLGRTALRQQVA